MDPIPLEYASSAAKPVSAVRFRLPVTLLVFANFLAAMIVLILGLLYLDRLAGASPFLIGGGILTGICIFSFLTNQQPRFGAAALCMLVSSVAGVIGFLQCASAYANLKSQIISGTTAPVVMVYIETDRGARLATLELTRAFSAFFTIISALVLLYCGYRYARLRHSSARQST